MKEFNENEDLFQSLSNEMREMDNKDRFQKEKELFDLDINDLKYDEHTLD